jgi:D-alanyl-D-alanine carboxypeptidase
VNRLARMGAATLALLCAFTIGAGVAVARLLPARLALFQMPQVSAARLPTPGPALLAATGSASGGPTVAGVTASLSAIMDSGDLGPADGGMVLDLATGRVLYSLNAEVGLTPASTTKLATAVAALDVLGPAARFATVVRQGATPAQLVLVGGGDPTLAAGAYPLADYPQPATLRSLAAATARSLRAKGIAAVRLSYDDRLFTGPEQALGWPALGAPDNYILTGNVAPIVGLEVDQGRLTALDKPEDADDPGNFSARSLHPGLDAVHAFAGFLRRDGITVRGRATRTAARARGPVIAEVRSPPLAQIVQWMLSESNNVIAETLARQVALATGKPATFSGAAAAVMAVDRSLGVTGVQIHDGSGLSPDDLISPQSLVDLVALAAGFGPAGSAGAVGSSGATGSVRPAHVGLRPVLTGLPVAGFSGTLGPGSFFGPFGQAALGTVRAKTGNLTAVATMAGLAYARDGQLLAFAFMGNKFSAKDQLLVESTLARLASAVASCGCR